jgi:hypothetical protein
LFTGIREWTKLDKIVQLTTIADKNHQKTTIFPTRHTRFPHGDLPQSLRVKKRIVGAVELLLSCLRDQGVPNFGKIVGASVD